MCRWGDNEAKVWDFSGDVAPCSVRYVPPQAHLTLKEFFKTIRVNILKLVLFILLLLTIPNVTANAVTVDTAGSTPQLSSELGTVYTEQQIQLIVDKYAKQYGVSSTKMMEVIECESTFRNVQSNHIKNGIREDSWGIVQIYLPAHPTVTKQQALDPYFAINFMAEKFSKGWYKWSCYK